ncbi:MAG: hypothetical protein ACREI8_08520 [Myxococcota bacterium]
MDVAFVSLQLLTIEGVSAAIDRAAPPGLAGREPGTKLTSKSRGRAIATATIVYDTRAFSIQLRSSVGLRQSGDKIHKLYSDSVRLRLTASKASRRLHSVARLHREHRAG